MKPIAQAIDFLQGEKNMLFGYFIPALITIKIKMLRLESVDCRFLRDVNVQMQNALIKRFEKYFTVQPDAMDAIIAAVVIPEIKMKFLNTLLETAENFTEEALKQCLYQYGIEFVEDSGSISRQPSISQQQFLDFGDNPNEPHLLVNPELACVSSEASAYFACNETDISSLHRYPIIKKIFLKYNTPLPSSAPVERLFSLAGIVNRSRRQKLSDEHFEMLVLRKANKC